MQLETAAAAAVAEAERMLAGMTPDQLAEIDKFLAFETWLPLPGPQTAAFYSEADELFYGGAAGGGKGLRPEEMVVTPYGYRAIGDLRLGERVLAADGTMAQVIGVYPQPVQDLYRVSFADGGELITDGPHRWNYSIARKGQWRKSGREWKVATTLGLMGMMAEGRRILIPLCEPLKFNKSYRYDQRPVDPYVLGLLLGDGYTAQSGPGAKWSFSTRDRELMEALTGDWVEDGECGYRVRGEERSRLQDAFDRLGLAGCKADTKHVPDSYLWGSVEQRRAVLQGLMDTDGTVSEDGKAYFCSISKQLARDVRWLVLSLGGRATITEKLPICVNGADGPTPGAKAFTVYVRMPDNRDLFRLERKRARAGSYNGGGKRLKRRVTDIALAGRGETVCIAIDHPSSLYVAGTDLVVTHNTDLLIGLALTAHRRSIIFRREATQLRGITDRMAAILGSREGLNGQAGVWRLPALGRQVDLGGVKDPGSEEKYQGIAHDLKAFDEITHFAEAQYRFLNGWKRTEREGQRVRTVCTGNPPVDSDGEWVTRYWGPWLDRDYIGTRPKPGELRWFAVIDGEDREVDGPAPIHHKAEIILPRSRTFIPSSVFDNPFYVRSGYVAQLQSLPEPLRSLMLHGDFAAARTPNPWQVIPEAWVAAAQERWSARTVKGPMSSVGVDVARGGKAEFVVATRHGWWFDELLAVPGSAVADGPAGAALVVQRRRDDCPVHVDIVGVGGSVYDALVANGIHAVPVNGAEGSVAHDKSGVLGFVNARSWAWWRMRELLDPAADLGLALPPDPQLKADLCAPRWRLTTAGIAVESKYKTAAAAEPEIVKRLGRSPDRGDAVVLAALETESRAVALPPVNRPSARARAWI